MAISRNNNKADPLLNNSFSSRVAAKAALVVKAAKAEENGTVESRVNDVWVEEEQKLDAKPAAMPS